MTLPPLPPRLWASGFGYYYSDDCLRAYAAQAVAMEWCGNANDKIERLRAERDSARAKVEYTTRLLAGIHALLYPPPVTTADGRTMVFRPKTLDPHEVLQELSDRIRALPDELAKEPT